MVYVLYILMCEAYFLEYAYTSCIYFPLQKYVLKETQIYIVKKRQRILKSNVIVLNILLTSSFLSLDKVYVIFKKIFFLSDWVIKKIRYWKLQENNKILCTTYFNDLYVLLEYAYTSCIPTFPYKEYLLKQTRIYVQWNRTQILKFSVIFLITLLVSSFLILD